MFNMKFSMFRSISIVGDLEQLNRHGFDGKANLITGIEIVPIYEIKF